MKQKKEVLRTCIVTKEKLPKKELLRIVRTPDGNVIVDETGKANGRGCYIKKEKEVLEKARKGEYIKRVLEVEISNDLYDEILKIIEE